MTSLKYLAPAGLVRLWDYQGRFRALALPAEWSRRRMYRKALEVSQIELLPVEKIASLQRVVDVGANLGEWCIGIALLTKAQEIIAYEPIPEVFKQLRENTQLYSQIRCVQSALGASTGQIEMNVYRRHQMSSILPIQDDVRFIHGMQHDIAVPVRVSVTTLDEDLRSCDEISLLKLDVQGYEPQVLMGARTVLQRTQLLMVEVTYSSYYRGDMQFEDLHQLIRSLSPLKLWGISAPHCAPSGKPMWADAVYVRPTD